MDQAFYAAVFNQPPLVLGQRLKPFSLAHYAALDAVHSPLIRGGDITQGDCLIAFSILSRSYPDCTRWVWGVYDGEAEREIRALAETVGPQDFGQVARLLVDWVGGSIKYRPKTWSRGETPGIKGSPVCYLVANLMRWCKMTERAAWNTGFAAAHWYIIEASGNDEQIVGEAEHEAIAALRQIQKESQP